MDSRQILHPVATGLTLVAGDSRGAAAEGTGDEVRSTSMIFLGVGTTSMTLSSPTSSPLSSSAELDDGALSEAPAPAVSLRFSPRSRKCSKLVTLRRVNRYRDDRNGWPGMPENTSSVFAMINLESWRLEKWRSGELEMNR